MARNRLREVRLGRLLTQQQLARRARVGLRTITNIEQGARCLVTTQRKILKALGIPFERRGEIFHEVKGS